MTMNNQDGGRLLAAWASVGILLLVGVATAQEPSRPQRPLMEFWEAVHLQGSQVGYAHGVFHTAAQGMIAGEEEMRLTIQRFNQPMTMQFQMTMRETNAGQVRAITHRQLMGRDQELIRNGRVEGGKLIMTKELSQQPPEEKVYPWNDAALGLYAQEQLYAKRDLRPGLQFDFLSFVPEFNTVLRTGVSVGEKQPTELLGGRKVPLWRATAQVEKVSGIQFPPMICWVNDSGELFKREQSIPGLGDLTFYRTSKERALMRSATAPQSDIGFSQLVRVNRAIPQFNQTQEVVYRVKLQGVEEPLKAFAQDDKQQLRLIGPDELEIRVRKQAPPRRQAGEANSPPEYLRSNHFIKSEDAEVKKLAGRAVGQTRDPWDKARRIEAWVRQNMTNQDYGKAFATAAETARALDGDCTEHAVLAAAMCRAAGVPSRTAIGLVHVPEQRAMCFHMWFEVWIHGQWYALDGTLGRGTVGGGHVKVLDAHWNDTDSFLPLLPVVRLLGKLKMDVVSVEYEAGVGPR